MVCNNKLGIYIHIPFCIKKCEYCDFLSFTMDEKVREQYVQCLIQDIRLFKEKAKGYTADTIFIGGGTPSILTGEQIQRILHAVYETYQLEEDTLEVTIEANPGTLTKDKLEKYCQAGINRLSIGLQSANNKELRLLGRIHTWEDFKSSYHLARKAGFENINVDLISALPGQTKEDYMDTLIQVQNLKPEHISAYGLIIEEGTPFYTKYEEDELRRERGEKTKLLPDEELEREMYEMTKSMLAQNDYVRYEISNYAKPGFACRHNIGYWTGKDYIGFGLGAASLIQSQRFCKTNILKEYLQEDFSYRDIQDLSKQDQIEEFIFLGLRMMKGISRAKFQTRFGQEIEDIYQKELTKLYKEGLLDKQEDRIFLTESGISVSNYVFEKFLQ